MDFFDLWTSTGGNNNAAYLIVSEKPYSNSFSLTKNEALAVSRNNPYMYVSYNSRNIDQLATRYFFDEPVLLKGGTVYYLYFATALAANSTDTYTLTNQRIATYPNGGATDNYVQDNYGPQYSTILTAVNAPAVTDMEGNELSESKYYRIALPGRDGIVAMTQNVDSVNPQTWTGGATQIWKVKKDGAGYKITAAQDGDNKFWKEVEFVVGNTKVTANKTEAEARTWTISKVSTLNNTYNITADNGSGTTYYFSNHGGGNNNMGFYNSNTGYDGGSLFTFTAVEQSNYVCQTLAGTVFRTGTAFVTATTESAPAISGWTISSATDGDPIVFKYTSAAATTFAANILSSTAPTLNGSTYEFANGTAWYAFRMHNAGTYWLKDNGAGGVTGAGTYDIDNNDNLWCFVGSPTNGYQIYNRNGKALSVATGANAQLGSTATTFDVLPSTVADGKPCFWILGAASGSSSYLNYNNGTNSLATYTDSDNGSTLHAIEFQLDSVYVYYGALANNVGSLSNQADFNKAKEDYILTPSESNLDALIAAYKAGTPIEFVDGQTYFVVSVGNSAKLATTTDGARLTHTAISANPAYTYWKLKKVGDNFTLQNLANGKYVSIPGTNSVTTIAMSNEAVNLAIAAGTALNYKTLATATTADKLLNQAANTATFADGVTVWHGSENANQWRFEEVNPAILTMLNPDAIAASNAVGEADVYMSYANATGADVQLPYDVTVYKVETGGSTADVNMTEVDTKVVPSGAGVVVKAKNGVEIPLLATSTTEDLTGNVLVPGNGSSPVDGFILAYKRGETTPKFYKMSSLTLGADKAYLPSTYFGSSVQAVSLNFGGLTGIESAQTEAQQDGQIFDLQGRRVEKAQKGLYIVNGKKVLVK